LILAGCTPARYADTPPIAVDGGYTVTPSRDGAVWLGYTCWTGSGLVIDQGAVRRGAIQAARAVAAETCTDNAVQDTSKPNDLVECFEVAIGCD